MPCAICSGEIAPPDVDRYSVGVPVPGKEKPKLFIVCRDCAQDAADHVAGTRVVPGVQALFDSVKPAPAPAG